MNVLIFIRISKLHLKGYKVSKKIMFAFRQMSPKILIHKPMLLMFYYTGCP